MGQPEQRALVMLAVADPLVGLDLADALEAAGYFVAGPFRTAAEAEAWLTRWNPALAVLDLEAEDEAGIRLARTLGEHGVPFLVNAEPNGAGSRSPVTAGVPRLQKPVWNQDVIDTMRELAARAGQAG